MVERRSVGPLTRLHRLPRFVLPVLMAALLVLALAVPGPVGLLAVAPLGLLVAWLTYLSWPRLDLAGRLLRAALLGLLLALVVAEVLAIAG